MCSISLSETLIRFNLGEMEWFYLGLLRYYMYKNKRLVSVTVWFWFDWMGDLGMDEDRPYLPSFAAPLNNPDPNSIRVDAWVVAEDPAREVLNCIHPTLDSEEKRKDVIEFVQKLIRFHLRLEVNFVHFYQYFLLFNFILCFCVCKNCFCFGVRVYMHI